MNTKLEAIRISAKSQDVILDYDVTDIEHTLEHYNQVAVQQ